VGPRTNKVEEKSEKKDRKRFKGFTTGEEKGGLGGGWGKGLEITERGERSGRRGL